MRPLVFVSSIGVLLVASRDVRAAVVVEAPAGCVQRDELGRRLSIEGDDRPVRVHVVREATGAVVTVIRGEGADASERSLRVRSCAEVASAAATIVALAREDPGPAPEPEPLPVLASPDISVTPPADRSPRRTTGAPPLAWGIFASAVGDAGSLPSATWGARAGVALTRGALRVEASGTWLSPSASAGSVGVSTTLQTGALRGCIEASGSSIRPGGCTGLELGVLTSEGFGLENARRGHSMWLSPTLDATVRIPVARALSVSGAVGGGAPLAKPTFFAEGTGRELHRTNALFARMSLGIEATFQ